MTSAPDVERLEKVARAALVGSPQGWTAHPADGDYDYFVDAGGAYLGACPDCGVRSSFDKEDATHIATFDPPAALALVAEVRELRAKVERVREVHEPIDAMMNPGRHERVVKVCIGCGTDAGNWQRWPCPTIRALGEEA